jgi:hypothetical protein
MASPAICRRQNIQPGVQRREAHGLTISHGNLTERASLKSGSSAQAIYRSIMTGLDGTPMPQYADTFGDKDKDVWDLVYFMLSLAHERQ